MRSPTCTRQQLAQVVGLGQIVVGAGGEPFDDSFLRLLRTEYDEVDIAQGLHLVQLPDRLKQLQAVRCRHQPVRDHDAVSHLANRLERSPPVAEGGNPITRVLELTLQKFARRGVILNDSDSPFCRVVHVADSNSPRRHRARSRSTLYCRR